MIIPLGTDRRLSRPTVVTYWLIAINVLVFVIGAIYGSPRVNPRGFEQLFQTLWLNPEDLRIWQFLSYQFLHAGILHLAGNMLFLFVFGPNVEDRFGRWGFLAFYIAGGAIAGGAHFLFESSPVVGASGAISAVTGAFLILFPNTHIRVFMALLFIGVFHFKAWWLIVFAIAKDLIFEGLGADQGVARLAHLGGYLYGAGVCVALLWTRLLPREPFDLFSMGRQAHRRRVFRELASSGRTAWTSEVGAGSKVKATKGAPVVVDDVASRARAEVTALLGDGKLDEAATKWEQLMDVHGELCLPRQAHLDLANHLFSLERRQSAATAYEIFLKRFPTDHQSAKVRLMLALLCARYLNDPVRARQLLDQARAAGLPETHRELAETLSHEIG